MGKKIRWIEAPPPQRIPQQFLPSITRIKQHGGASSYQAIKFPMYPEPTKIPSYVFPNVYRYIFLPNELPNLSHDFRDVIHPLFPMPFTKLLSKPLVTNLFPDILPSYFPTNIPAYYRTCFLTYFPIHF
jgi:hypothetical protein